VRSKPITSQDVARRAGVSRATVSLVLNQVESAQISPETAQRVFQAAQELNYVPVAAAQALVSRRSQCIGLVLSRQRHNIGSDVVLNHMIESVLDTLHPAGMRLMIDVVEDFFDHDSYLKLVRSRQVDGIILCGPRFDDEALGRLMDDGFPTVLIGRLPGSPVYSVDIDNVAAAREATAHLISLGRRRIACITNAQPIYAASIDRLEGYRQALEAASIPFDDCLVRYGNYVPESGYEQMLSLLDSGQEFDAVFIASDVVAIGALAALRERGLNVPEDVAVMGFDDVPQASYTSPPLSSIHLPFEQITRQATEALLAIISDRPPPERQKVLPFKLVVRQSCGGLTQPVRLGGA